MRHPIFILIFVFLVSSCHQQQSDKAAFIAGDLMMEEEMIPITRQEQNSPPPLPPRVTQEVIKKKIIKDGRISIEVQELEQTKTHIDSLVKKYGGYYANERLNNSDWEISYKLKIRVPSNNFERLIAEVEAGGGEIKYKEIDARDVTDQFIDLEIRLTNKKNYLRKYNDLLKQAKSVKDILEIEEKIRGIEEEIESTTGRLKYLSDLVDFSTLDLEVSKSKDSKYQLEKRANFTKRLKHALSKGWFGFVDFLVFAIKIWPFWIIAGLIFFGWKKYRQKKG
ncbi:DUF4349 domain-containing protein [Ancylomarina sp. 16SWW S1-10-2]|uniref:DUF4349 domain-containing protein n=1 Tax=Ancylomarina sp. 16SWW S1-10-2 TaxID=2499681 RepID=UPI0012AE04F2|nr:DUF4349 domain-containing protein [Ancylomarina sp. 16SWW S1-10-2]MRT93643.1 DUF4349 domain-containing protein [Ancylomarina sp. 16SWW S1-10-2]